MRTHSYSTLNGDKAPTTARDKSVTAFVWIDVNILAREKPIVTGRSFQPGRIHGYCHLRVKGGLLPVDIYLPSGEKKTNFPLNIFGEQANMQARTVLERPFEFDVLVYK